ncbi:hypothetical protein CSG_8640 [Campylobacter fetus subsp. venerealis str. 84-112]|nr:hypothetical protein CSG_8640 [Campylobacter fetus subsp. venerealis str. 84-112]
MQKTANLKQDFGIIISCILCTNPCSLNYQKELKSIRRTNETL